MKLSNAPPERWIGTAWKKKLLDCLTLSWSFGGHAEQALFFATQQHFAGKGLAARRDVSLVVLDDHPAFEWFEPEVSHIRTHTRRFVPRVVQWVENVSKGRQDRRETLIRAEFVDGGTIGPVPQGN